MNTTATTRYRVDWVDYAKGICIFFVVMLHVNDLVQNHVKEIGWLEHVVLFARPFRMPDFFLIAGLFLSQVINRPWRLYIDRKVVHFYYFYLLWMTVEFLVFDARHSLAEGASTAAIAQNYLLRFVNPSGALWFIHILPLFFLVTRVTKSVPWWAMWLAGAAIHSLQPHTGWVVIDEFAARYIYFYSGYMFAQHVFRIADWALRHTRAALLYLVGWALLNGALVQAGWSGLPGVSLFLGYAGALAIIFTAGLVSKVSWTKPVRFIGEHSIVLYLADYVVSVVVMRLFLPFIPDVGSLALTVTVATVLGTVLLWQVLLRTPLRFMYVRPDWLHLVPAKPGRVTPAKSAASQA
ncbi:MAG: acyltransferase family protein [Burkholderiales bacterium]